MFYIMLTYSEYNWCQGKMLKRCTQGLAMKEAENANCALALFLNQEERIAELCDFSLQKKAPETHIIGVRANRYLISTVYLVWLQICTGATHVHVKSCHLCIISLPCGCFLKAKSFFSYVRKL